jgi:hypothetical protein
MDGIFYLVIVSYLILHIPAFILLGIGIAKNKKEPETAKKLFIIAGIYFIIGGGICGSMMF